MPRFISILFFTILFNIQTTPPPISELPNDENQVKRLLIFYSDAGIMDWSADGKLVLMNSFDDTVRLWDAETLDERYNRKHSQYLWGALFNAAGDRFLTWSKSRIRTWDTETGRLLGTLDIDSNFGFRGVLWRGNQVINSIDGMIHLWDGISQENNTGFLVYSGNFRSDYPSDLRWNTARNRFLDWGGLNVDGRILVWEVADDFKSATQVMTFLPATDGIHGASWSPDESMIASWSDNQINIVDVETGTFLNIDLVNTHIRYPIWSPNSRYLLTEDWPELEIHIWDVKTGENVLTIPGRKAIWDTTGERLLTWWENPSLIAVPSGEALAVEFPSDFRLEYGRWNVDGVRLLLSFFGGFQVWIIPPQDRCVVYALAPANLRPQPRTDSERADVLPIHRLAAVIDQAVDTEDFIWWQLDNELWVRSDIVEETGHCFN